MNFVLFDEDLHWKNLLPLTFTRPVSEIRIGILTIREKWERHLNTTCSYHTQAYLHEKFPAQVSEDTVCILSGICPDSELVAAIQALQKGEVLMANKLVLAWRGQPEAYKTIGSLKKIVYLAPVLAIDHVWDIFQKNAEALSRDYSLITHGRPSQKLSETVTVIGQADRVFLEEGAIAEACIFNTLAGPIYIGKYAEVMEGSAIRGPFALGEHSALKLNTKIYGATTIGPHCKVGGEVSNSVIFGYSNKAHDGFLGNSVLGEWCNLGADTNTSNLKNNYASVKLYNYVHHKQMDSGLQFCGLIMGDHSKSGINTMFNTGTVAGIGCNIYGGGFPATVIPNFSWGGSEGFEKYQLDKLVETAQRVFARRGLTFDEKEERLLSAVKKFYS